MRSSGPPSGHRVSLDLLEPRRLLTTWYVDAASPGPTPSGSSWAAAYHPWLRSTTGAPPLIVTAGQAIEAADQRKDYSNVANLVRAAGMQGKDRPAVLARLFVLPVPNTIVAYPLAALTPKHHLRLGL